MKNIYIIGQVRGSYRTQHLIKFLLDRGYGVYYNSNIIQIFINNKKGIKRLMRIIVRAFDLIVNFCAKIYNILISEIVILPAMCNEKQFELFVAMLLKKKIITDFYISMYDTHVLDYKTVNQSSYKAKKLLRNDYYIVSKADVTLFLNRTEANRYLRLINIPFNPQKHLIVPLVVEETIKCDLPFFKKKSNTMNICWWGNYIPLHGLDKIIQACKRLKDNSHVNFHLYLFGTNEDKSISYKNMILDLGLESEITIDNNSTFKNGKLGNFLQTQCDLVLGNFGESEKSKNVLVNKVIDGVAMKAPVLTGESLATKDYFNELQIFICNNNEKSIAASIEVIYDKPYQMISNYIDSAFNTYQENFSPKAFEINMNIVFDHLEN